MKAPLRRSYAPRRIRKVMQLSGQTQHGARRAPRYLECKGKGERLCIFSEMEPFVVDRFDDSRDGNLGFSGLRSEYHNWRLSVESNTRMDIGQRTYCALWYSSVDRDSRQCTQYRRPWRRENLEQE